MPGPTVFSRLQRDHGFFIYTSIIFKQLKAKDKYTGAANPAAAAPSSCMEVLKQGNLKNQIEDYARLCSAI
jgi:hypothetical protein